MEKTPNDFKSEIEIDKYALDQEFEVQPILYHKYAEQLVQAEHERDKLKDNLELTKANLDLEVRKNPKKFGFEKVTEAVVQNLVTTSQDYEQALKQYLDASKTAKTLKLALEVLNQKKSSLENLVRLYLGEYYSKEAPKEIKEAMTEKVSRIIHEDLNRRMSDG